MSTEADTTSTQRALAYRTLLIWPYAVAPAVAGVLWAFIFAPSICIVTYVLRRWGIGDPFRPRRGGGRARSGR